MSSWSCRKYISINASLLWSKKSRKLQFTGVKKYLTIARLGCFQYRVCVYSILDIRQQTWFCNEIGLRNVTAKCLLHNLTGIAPVCNKNLANVLRQTILAFFLYVLPFGYGYFSMHAIHALPTYYKDLYHQSTPLWRMLGSVAIVHWYRWGIMNSDLIATSYSQLI